MTDRTQFEARYRRPDGAQWNRMLNAYQETWEELGSDRDEQITEYNRLFECWCAALASVVIELPPVYGPDAVDYAVAREYDDPQRVERMEAEFEAEKNYRAKVAGALTEAGLKVSQ